MSADTSVGDHEATDDEQPSDLIGVARLAATAGLHTAEWAARASAKGMGRLLGVVVRPDTAIDLVNDVRREVRSAARDLVGYADIEERVRAATADSPTAQRVAQTAQKVASAVPYPVPPPPPKDEGEPSRRSSKPATAPSRKDKSSRTRNGHRDTLRDRGEELLRKSRDVWYEYEAHPAYERILEELAPDEARILKLMLADGPQPSVDVRTGGPIGLLHSELIAPGLNMIGARAGCRYVERVPSYLNNLQRLGLIWFSRETLHDHLAYQVVEAQPDVLEAMHSVRAAKIVRRSIHLTPFGEDFCRDCLALGTADLTSLPEHSTPTARKMGASAPME